MLKAKDVLTETLRKMLLIQAVLTLIAAVIALLTKGNDFALALIYGGAVTMVGTWIHAWRLKVATTPVENGPTLDVAGVFAGILLKLMVMAGLLAIGMTLLKLHALAVLLGFLIAYTGFLFGRGYAPRSRPRD